MITTTTTQRGPAAIIARAECGHAVAVYTAEPAYAHHAEEMVEDGRRRGLTFELVDVLPGPGALTPSCPRCRIRPRG